MCLTVLDKNEIIAAAEKEIARKGTAVAKYECVYAVTQNDISHDANESKSAHAGRNAESNVALGGDAAAI